MKPASRPTLQNGSRQLRFALLAAALIVAAKAQTPIGPRDLEAPKIEIASGSLNFTVEPSVVGRRYQLQRSDTMASGTWQDLGPVLTGDGHNLVISIPYNPSVPQHFYLLVLDNSPPAPEGMSLIPEGSFQMGDQSNPLEGDADELPAHSVFVSGFWLGRTEVTKEQWDAVYSWATDNGYGFENPGEAKAGNHPVQTVSWYDVVKWCNLIMDSTTWLAMFGSGAGIFMGVTQPPHRAIRRALPPAPTVWYAGDPGAVSRATCACLAGSSSAPRSPSPT